MVIIFPFKRRQPKLNGASESAVMEIYISMCLY